MQLVDPEDIPAIERLTQEVLLLREKVASVEPQSQEVSGNQRQQVSSWDTGSSGASTAYLSTSVQSSESLCASPVYLSARPSPYPPNSGLALLTALSAGYTFLQLVFSMAYGSGWGVSFLSFSLDPDQRV